MNEEIKSMRAEFKKLWDRYAMLDQSIFNMIDKDVMKLANSGKYNEAKQLVRESYGEALCISLNASDLIAKVNRIQKHHGNHD